MRKVYAHFLLITRVYGETVSSEAALLVVSAARRGQCDATRLDRSTGGAASADRDAPGGHICKWDARG